MVEVISVKWTLKLQMCTKRCDETGVHVTICLAVSSNVLLMSEEIAVLVVVLNWKLWFGFLQAYQSFLTGYFWSLEFW